jgi:hypothetical protein
MRTATFLVDSYVVETLMPDLIGHDRRPSAFAVYLYLWRRTGGRQSRSAALSLKAIAEGTGLSKRAVQAALRTLVRRRLVSVRRGGPTAVPEYTVLRPWARRGRPSEPRSARGRSGAADAA